MSGSALVGGVLIPTGCDCMGEKAAVPQTHSRVVVPLASSETLPGEEKKQSGFCFWGWGADGAKG